MKRASYRDGVAWIALNDEGGSDDRLNAEVISGYISTLLLADLFSVEPERVAADVVAYRDRSDKAERVAQSIPTREHVGAENFLASLSGDREADRLNLAMDARSYGWSQPTVKRVMDGIAKFYAARDAARIGDK